MTGVPMLLPIVRAMALTLVAPPVILVARVGQQRDDKP